MADIADMAAAAEEQMLELAQRARQQQPVTMGPPECGCGEPIPIVRRQMGLDTCIDCAREAEARGRRFA